MRSITASSLLVLLAVHVAATAARAEMRAPEPRAGHSELACTAPSVSEDVTFAFATDAIASGVRPISSSPPVPGVDASVPEHVMQVPNAPNSLQLVLSALVSAGAWQLTRAAKGVHFAVPDWYHTGGPCQVGHATPLSLDRDLSIDALPSFYDACIDLALMLHPLERIDDARFSSILAFLPPAGPRAPPAL